MKQNSISSLVKQFKKEFSSISIVSRLFYLTAIVVLLLTPILINAPITFFQFASTKNLATGCTVTPNPVKVNNDFTIRGVGYAPNTPVRVNVIDTSGISSYYAQTDPMGSFNLTERANSKTSNTVQIWDQNKNKPFPQECSFLVK